KRFLNRGHVARCAICHAPVHSYDTRSVSDLGKYNIAKFVAVRVRFAESDGCNEAPFARAFGISKVADRSGHIAKSRHHFSRPVGRIVQPLEILGSGNDAQVVTFVEAEELWTTVDGDVAPAPTKARDAHPLRHVFTIVPFVKFRLRLRHDVVPDRHNT